MTHALQAKISIKGWEKTFKEINRMFADQGISKVVLADPNSPMTIKEGEAMEDFIEQQYPDLQCAIVHGTHSRGSLVVHIKRRGG